MDQITDLLDIRKSKYAREILDGMKHKAEKKTFGESIMFYPYWKDVNNPCSGKTDEDEDLTKQLENTVHHKLTKCRNTQISLIGYSLMLIVYTAGLFMQLQNTHATSSWWIIAAVISLICSTLFFCFSIIHELLWKDPCVSITLYTTRLLLHALYIAVMMNTSSLPIFVKIATIRSAAIINVMTDTRFIGPSLLIVISDGFIMTINSSLEEALPRTTFQTVTCLCCYIASSCYFIFFFLWTRSSYDDLSGFLSMVLDKLILNIKTYNALGGEPTFWQMNPPESSKNGDEELIVSMRFHKQLSCPGEINPTSAHGPTLIETLVAQGSPALRGFHNQKDDSRVSVSADQIENILKSVYYTNFTKQKGFSEHASSHGPIEGSFTAVFNNFKVQLARDLMHQRSINMTSVWEQLVDQVLSKFNCLIEVVNLELRSDGSPAAPIQCTMRIFSIWSSSEKSRIFYSKLQREEHLFSLSHQQTPKSMSPQFRHYSPLPIVHEKNEREDMPSTPSPTEFDSPCFEATPVSRDILENSNFEVSLSAVNAYQSPSKKGHYKPEELISVVVHDMRTPLMCVLGNLELLEYEMKNKPGYDLVQPLIKSSTASCALLENLVSDIMDAARISKGIFKIEPTKFNLEETARDCISIMGMAAGARQIRLHLDYVAAHKLITSDKHRLKQVFLNFMTNSIKFTDKGDIWIRIYETPGTIKITIKDNGCGIQPDLIPQLFQKYQSDRKTGGNTKGIGLGLFICKSIISNLGPKKDIAVFSEVGKGTEFTFEIYKDVEEKADSKKLTKMTTWNNRRKFVEGSYGFRTSAYSSYKQIDVKYDADSPRSSLNIFALNDQSSIASRRLIQTKMKWDISWVTKQSDKLDEKPSDKDIQNRSGVNSLRRGLQLVASGNEFTISPQVAPDSLQAIELADEILDRPALLRKASMGDIITPRSTSSHLKVLIVDDEPMILELIRDFFDAAGADLNIEVVEDSASSVEEARDKLSTSSYDLVLLDYYLPDGTGPEFVQEYLAIHGNDDKIPLFALSTGADMSEIQNEVDIGIFFSILLKPITLSKFKDLLRDVNNTRHTK